MRMRSQISHPGLLLLPFRHFNDWFCHNLVSQQSPAKSSVKMQQNMFPQQSWNAALLRNSQQLPLPKETKIARRTWNQPESYKRETNTFMKKPASLTANVEPPNTKQSISGSTCMQTPPPPDSKQSQSMYFWLSYFGLFLGNNFF